MLPPLLLSRVFFGVLLDERNRVIADNIRKACAAEAARCAGDGPEGASPTGEVVAVLGAAHVNGVRRLLMCPDDDDAETNDGP